MIKLKLIDKQIDYNFHPKKENCKNLVFANLFPRFKKNAFLSLHEDTILGKSKKFRLN